MKALVRGQRLFKRWVTTPNTLRYRIEVAAVLRLLRRFPRPPGVLLDVGAGCGEMSLRLREAGLALKLTAVEPDPRNFAQLHRMYAGHSGAICRLAALPDLPFPDGAFDLVLCTQVLEHIVDHRAAARELMRVLSPSGRLVVSVPFIPPGRRPEECPHHDPVGHVRPGYTEAELADLFAPEGGAVRGVEYFYGEVTHRRWRALQRWGWIGRLAPVAWVDQDRALSTAPRPAESAFGLVGLLTPRGPGAAE